MSTLASWDEKHLRFSFYLLHAIIAVTVLLECLTVLLESLNVSPAETD